MQALQAGGEMKSYLSQVTGSDLKSSYVKNTFGSTLGEIELLLFLLKTYFQNFFGSDR